MTAEISIGISKNLINGNLRDTNQNNNFKVDQTTANFTNSSPTITTSDSVLDTSAITTLGWLFIKNLDATNFVNVGPEATAAIVPFIQVQPGEEHAFRVVPGTVIRIQADTGNVQIEVTFYED